MLPLILAIYAGPEERALIARLQRRDPQALAELYDNYGRAAFALVLRVVRDRAIAEDLVQETFLRVWNRIHLINSDKGSIGPWLLAIARNRAIDYLRSSAGRERNIIELNETDHAPLYREMEAEILISDQARRVKAAMERLAPHYRTVMELAYFEGLSQSEMSIKMGQPLGTIKTWVRTALQSLRDDLGVAGAVMNCDELRDHYDLYALDISEEPERSEIRAHLHRSCEVCMPGVKRSLETVTLIGASAPWAEPSSQLRSRILTSVGFQQRASIPGWASALAIAALGLVALYLGVSSKQYEQTAARLRSEIREQSAQIASLTEAFCDSIGPQHNRGFLRRRATHAARRQGVPESVAWCIADRSQSAAYPGRQDLRDVDHPQRREAGAGRLIPIAGWQGDAHPTGGGECGQPPPRWP